MFKIEVHKRRDTDRVSYKYYGNNNEWYLGKSKNDIQNYPIGYLEFSADDLSSLVLDILKRMRTEYTNISFSISPYPVLGINEVQIYPNSDGRVAQTIEGLSEDEKDNLWMIIREEIIKSKK